MAPNSLLALLLAFVMPTHSVLKRYAGKRDSLSTSQMKATGVAVISPVLAREVAPLLGINWNAGDLNVTATLSVRLPGRCRLELSSPESTKVIAVSSANGQKKVEGTEVKALSEALTEACALLAVKTGEDESTRETISRHLSALKVETKSVSLARLGNSVQNVSFVIGNRAEGQPQFWVYKGDSDADKEANNDPNAFQAARLKYNDEKGTAWDLRFADYTSQITFNVWPRVIDVSKGTEPQLRLMMLQADLKADLSNTKF